MFELTLAMILGLVSFLEPCSIATYTLNSARLHKGQTKEKLLGLSQMLIIKSLLLIAIFNLLVYILKETNIPSLVFIIALLVFASMFILSKFIYFYIPHLEFFRCLPKHQNLSQSLKLSLSIPACNIPMILLMSFLLINAHSYLVATLAAILFTFFYTLPTLYFITRGFSPKIRTFFGSLGGVMPTLTAIFFVFIALYLLSGYFSIDLKELKDQLQHPTIYAIIIGFITGFVFSFNPVSFASIPMMLAYVVKGKEKNRALILGGSFILGMLLTHLFLGAVAAFGGEWVKGLMGRHWGLVLGPVLIILGLLWSGLITVRLPWFTSKAYKIASVGGAFLLAIPFSIAVCPFCTPALLVMLTSSVAVGSVGFGVALLGAFALGRSIPMILGAISMSWLEKMSLFTKYQKIFEKISALVLIFIGLYLLNEYFFILGY